MRLPNVNGRDLQRRQRHFPRDFTAPLNLVFVPFQQWQQAQVDSWIPLALDLTSARDGFDFFEFPTIQRMNPLAATFINEGMRAGIRDDDTRGRTITLYLDKAAFQRALDIPGDGQMQVFLLDDDGLVLWRAAGVHDSEKEEALRAFLASQPV